MTPDLRAKKATLAIRAIPASRDQKAIRVTQGLKGKKETPARRVIPARLLRSRL